ncbi:MAG: SDR family NAD(P)-dependent oxidoreductase [Bacillota bacterium]
MKKDTILITGATKGLGRALSYQLARNNRTLVLIGRSEDLLTDLARDLTQNGAKVFTYSVDLTEIDKLERLVETILTDVGSIDIIINNAGFGLFEYATGTSKETTANMFQLNVLAMMELNRLLIPEFIKQKTKAHIINIGSIAGKLATPKASSYAATKHAVIGYSNALRLELKATNVAVTTVNLGPVKTSFFKTADESGHYEQAVEKIMLTPEKVATKIDQLLYTNKRELNLPFWMSVGSKIHALFPRTLEFFMQGAFNKK